MSLTVRPRIAAAILASLAPAGAAAASPDAPVPLYDDLGTYHRKVTTSSPAAQDYFDQGMMLAYAFGRPDAVRSFRAALASDPDCAACSWGEAWALGPYINEKMDDEAAVEAYAAAQHALSLAGSVSEVERGLIEAMAARYAESPEGADRDELDRRYADAMRDLAARFPDDPDVGALFGEALMVLYPWDLWPGGEPRPETTEAIAALEGVLDRDLRHAGACHLYIHAVEASSEPRRAEACADLLADGIPLGSHIQHMPSHIYMRIGRYGDAVRANQVAHIVDEMAERDEAVAIYPAHNVAMLWYAAWMDGQSSVAIQAGRDVARMQPSRAWAYPLALARFGRWDDLIEMTGVPGSPGDSLSKGMWQFARGLALLRQGPPKKAARALRRLARIRDRTDEDETFGPRTEDGPIHLLRIAHGILAGETAAAGGDTDEAVRLLEEALAVEDGLEYREPEIWPIPVRQVLGAVLLEAGRAADAQRVYEEELADHAENGWSLFGLAESLRAQGDEEGAGRARERFEAAWARADVYLTSSRF